MSTPLASVCVSAEVLRDWLEDHLDEIETASVGVHLEHCGRCRALLETLTQDAELQSLVRGCGPLPNGADGNVSMGALVETLRGLSRRTQPPPHAALTFLAPPMVEGDLGTLTHYRVLERIGQGGMGVVLKAMDTRLQRTVALKVIRPELVDDSNQLQRFQREGQALAGVKHPNVVEVYAVEQPENGPPYLVMEYVPGPTLAERLREQTRLDPRDAADLVAQVARGLAAAHQVGLTHRDVKPGNIILEEGTNRAKLVDFGLVQLGQEATRLTRTGTVAGTLEYMSPEQVEPAGQVGPASDVYGLGVTLYEALTGEVPFRGTTAVVLRQVLNEDPVPPQRRNEQVPRDLETICLKCLEKEAHKRYASGEALADDCQRFLSGRPILARPTPPWVHWIKWVKRHPAAATILTMALVGLLIVWRYEISVGEAEKNTAVAEKNAAVQKEQRRAADQIATTNEYHALLSGVAESEAVRQPGWTWKGREDLLKAANLEITSKDPLRLRNLAVRSLATVDLRQIRTLKPGVNAFCLAFSPDGKLLAVGDSKGTGVCKVVLFAGDTWDKVRELPIVSAASKSNFSSVFRDLNSSKVGVRSLAFSSDSRWLAVGTRIGDLHLWDLTRSDEKPIRSWPAHKDEVNGLAFSPGDKELASCSWDKHFKIWSLDSSPAKPIKDYEHSGKLKRITWNASGHLVVGDDVSLLLFSAANLSAAGSASKPQRLLWAGSTGLHCLDPESYQVFVAASLGLVGASHDPRLHSDSKDWWLTREGSEIHTAEIHQLALHPTGAFLVTGSDDRTIRVWDRVTGHRLATLPIPGTDQVFPAFHPHGRYLATTAGHEVLVYEIGSLELQTQLAHHPYPLRSVAWLPNSQTLACLSGQTGIANQVATDLFLCDLRDGRRSGIDLLMQPPEHFDFAFHHLTVHPTRPGLAFTTGLRDGVYTWDPTLGEKLKLTSSPGIRHISFARNGRDLWGASSPPKEESRVLSWTLPALGVPSSQWKYNPLPRAANVIMCVCAGEQWVLAGAQNGSVVLFDSTKRDDPKQKWSNLGGPVDCLALSPDEGLAAFGIRNGLVQVRRLPGGEIVGELKQHENRITSVAFGPDNLLVTAAADRKILFWRYNGQAFENVLSLPTTGSVLSVQFSPDGHKLAVLIQNERAVRVWHLDRLRQRLGQMGLNWE